MTAMEQVWETAPAQASMTASARSAMCRRTPQRSELLPRRLI
jgi:hypothetical protein